MFLAGATALGAGSLIIGPTGKLGRAFAQDGKTLSFAAAGTVTSSWDPSSIRLHRRSLPKAFSSAI